jgi:type I restriction enzyme, S subunit
MRRGWEIKKLGEVCDIIGGGTPSKAKKEFYTGTIPWATVRDMQSDFLSKTEFKINESAAKNSSTNIIPKGNIIIATRVGLGKVCILKSDTAINQDLKGIIPKKKNLLDTNFLFHWFKITGEEIIKHGTGATVQGVRVSFIEALEIPIPPIDEQKRIVEILDEAFAAIDKAKANVEKNLQNAKELFESYLRNVFVNKGDDWEEKKLEDVVDEKCTLSYGIVQPGEEYLNGLPVVRPTDLTSKLIQVEGLKKINPALAEGYKRTKLVGDELLLCVRGSTGVVSIATKELKGANVTRGIVPIRFKTNVIQQAFAYYLLISKYMQQQITSKTYGAALMQINIGDVRKLSVLVPPIDEQNKLIYNLDNLLQHSKRLEEIYQSKLYDLEELKKSILQKAFSGELTEKEVAV